MARSGLRLPVRGWCAIGQGAVPNGAHNAAYAASGGVSKGARGVAFVTCNRNLLFKGANSK